MFSRRSASSLPASKRRLAGWGERPSACRPPAQRDDPPVSPFRARGVAAPPERGRSDSNPRGHDRREARRAPLRMRPVGHAIAAFPSRRKATRSPSTPSTRRPGHTRSRSTSICVASPRYRRAARPERELRRIGRHEGEVPRRLVAEAEERLVLPGRGGDREDITPIPRAAVATAPIRRRPPCLHEIRRANGFWTGSGVCSRRKRSRRPCGAGKHLMRPASHGASITASITQWASAAGSLSPPARPGTRSHRASAGRSASAASRPGACP